MREKFRAKKKSIDRKGLRIRGEGDDDNQCARKEEPIVAGLCEGGRRRKVL